MNVIPRDVMEPDIVFDIFSVERVDKVRGPVAITAVTTTANVVVPVSAAGETVFLVREKPGDEIDCIIRDWRQ